MMTSFLRGVSHAVGRMSNRCADPRTRGGEQMSD